MNATSLFSVTWLLRAAAVRYAIQMVYSHALSWSGNVYMYSLTTDD